MIRPNQALHRTAGAFPASRGIRFLWPPQPVSLTVRRHSSGWVVPDEVDREMWDTAWRARKDCGLPDGCKLELSSSKPSFGAPMMVTVAADPPEFADRVWRQSDVCPICGESTLNRVRIGAMLDVQYEGGFGCLIGV